ncbi:MAG: 1-(5-phosphoribosyl)-5-[(5-phosphoribosylamino)methylideneamino]imidazole-4-carboxamide isomerase [Candidatus Sumerlaeaceae bacterium]
MSFQIIPAIDLMDGGCVRLQQGDANRKTKYDIAPADVARSYEKDGARRIHVVDLDGAFSGTPKNIDAIRAIRTAVESEIEVGGGVRDLEAIETLLTSGVNFVVIGTKALEDLEFLSRMVRNFTAQIIVGADARDGFLSTRGWTKDTQIEAVPYLRKLHEEIGLNTVIFTDIARDGMFNAPNIEALEDVLSISSDLKVIASGGVGTIDHILALQRLNRPNLLGVIVGKALYDGRVSLRDANAALQSGRTPGNADA